MALVQVHDLEQWGRTVDARERLGRLLPMLIRGTLGPNATVSIRFLHSVAMQLPGWDGTVETTTAGEGVPLGQSVWELGTGSGDISKIRSDFKKRIGAELPDGWIASNVTFVATILSKLKDPDKLAKELKANSPWKSVEVVDAVKIANWLDRVLSADLWTFEQIRGVMQEGISSLEAAMQEWASITRPEIKPCLVTASRGSNLDHVKESIARGVGIQIDADSPDEAMAFVHAAIASLGEQVAEDLLSRAIVISTAEAMARFARNNPLLLLLKGGALSHSARLESEGHQVVRLHARNSRSLRRGLQLDRQQRHDFALALQEMGVPPEKSVIEARACGSSASVWRVWNQLNETEASAVMPQWADPQYADLVVPAVLLGGWSEQSQADLLVVEKITGRPYATVRDQLLRINALSEPFVEVMSDVIVVSAPATAFALMGKLVGREVIGRFTEQAKYVFSQIDPQVDMDPDERMYAGLHGQILPHSEWLREGIAGSLLRMSVLGNQLEHSGAFGPGVTAQHFVTQLVRDLPGLRENIRLLASLRDQLPVLAEAAPEPFIEALEALLQGDREGLAKLFAESSDFSSHALHPGILWSLEVIAWDPTWLSRVLIVLGGLDSVYPGGRLSNRPIESIVSILLPWLPGTAATVEQRLHALDALAFTYPEGAWKALLRLLPRATSTASGTHRPEWRETGRAQNERVPAKEVGALYSAYVDKAINLAKGDVERTSSMIASYPDLAEKHRAKLEEITAGLIRDKATNDTTSLWSELRKLIAHHRQFPDAPWSLSDAPLNRLESLMGQLEPEEELEKSKWLFVDHMPELPISRMDHNRYMDELSRRRASVLKTMLTSSRKEDFIKELVRATSWPASISLPLVEIEPDLGRLLEIQELAMSEGEPGRRFARNLSAVAHAKHGERWTKRMVEWANASANPNDALATGLVDYPESVQLIESVRLMGREIEKNFWAMHSGFVRSDSPEVELAAALKLKEHGRARDALVIYANRPIGLGGRAALELLMAAIAELESGAVPQITSLGHWIEESLKKIRSSGEADKQDIARAEYKLLPLLTRGFEKKDLVLHEIMAEQPEFFVEVLSDLYKKESDEKREVSPDGASRARYAWDLLQSWKMPPGMGADGLLDPGKLEAWVDRAREVARLADRTTIGDQHIGKILFHIPPHASQAWPPESLRDLLERLANDEIEKGIAIEHFNSRGATWRGMFEGGSQERDLAAEWRARAEEITGRWPRTQRLLRRIADHWESQANHQDGEAEKDRRRFT